jgi:hypothetical protein
MGIKTRKEMRMELENYKELVFERLGGRDIQRAVEELIQKAEDAIIDEVGMPEGWSTENEDHQFAVLEIVAEQLIANYFTPQPEPAPTIDDI